MMPLENIELALEIVGSLFIIFGGGAIGYTGFSFKGDSRVAISIVIGGCLIILIGLANLASMVGLI